MPRDVADATSGNGCPVSGVILCMVPTITLNNGVDIPQLGFGVFQIEQTDTAEAVVDRAGGGLPPHRHRADVRQRGRGRAGDRRRSASPATSSSSPRSSTTTGTAATRPAGRSTRAWTSSASTTSTSSSSTGPARRRTATWRPGRASSRSPRTGRPARSASPTSSRAHLQRLAAETATVPAVNQIELHPYFQQTELRAYHRDHGIATEAWSPLGKGRELLQDERLGALAEKYGKTPRRSCWAGTCRWATSCSRSR